MTLKKMADFVSYIDSLELEEAKHLLNASAIQKETQSMEEYIKTLLMYNARFGELNEGEQRKYVNMLATFGKLGEAPTLGWDSGSIYKDSASKAKQAAEAKKDYDKKIADLNKQAADEEEAYASFG